MMLAAVMTIQRTWGNAEEKIYDRSYRLRYNKGQVLMDKVGVEYIYPFHWIFFTDFLFAHNVKMHRCHTLGLSEVVWLVH